MIGGDRDAAYSNIQEYVMICGNGKLIHLLRPGSAGVSGIFQGALTVYTIQHIRELCCTYAVSIVLCCFVVPWHALRGVACEVSDLGLPPREGLVLLAGGRQHEAEDSCPSYM